MILSPSLPHLWLYVAPCTFRMVCGVLSTRTAATHNRILCFESSVRSFGPQDPFVAAASEFADRSTDFSTSLSDGSHLSSDRGQPLRLPPAKPPRRVEEGRVRVLGTDTRRPAIS
jgi:hypothetical protein